MMQMHFFIVKNISQNFTTETTLRELIGHKSAIIERQE